MNPHNPAFVAAGLFTALASLKIEDAAAAYCALAVGTCAIISLGLKLWDRFFSNKK